MKRDKNARFVRNGTKIYLNLVIYRRNTSSSRDVWYWRCSVRECL